MLAADGVVLFLLFALWLWALFDCISTDAALCRNLPKGVWLIIVLLLPDIGSLAWLLLGRPERAGRRPGSADYSTPRRPVGLEDDPRYSASPSLNDRRSAELDERLRQWELEQAQAKELETPTPPAPEAATPDRAASPPRDLEAWERDLRRREDELRRRELEQRERDLQQREQAVDDDT